MSKSLCRGACVFFFSFPPDSQYLQFLQVIQLCFQIELRGKFTFNILLTNNFSKFISCEFQTKTLLLWVMWPWASCWMLETCLPYLRNGNANRALENREHPLCDPKSKSSSPAESITISCQRCTLSYLPASGSGVKHMTKSSRIGGKGTPQHLINADEPEQAQGECWGGGSLFLPS